MHRKFYDMPDRNNTNRVRRRRFPPEPRHSPCQYGGVLAAATSLLSQKSVGAGSSPKDFRWGYSEHDLWGKEAAGFDAGTLHMCKVSRTLPCGDMAQPIVYILANFGCAKAPKRIALRPVCIIPVWHTTTRPAVLPCPHPPPQGRKGLSLPPS